MPGTRVAAGDYGYGKQVPRFPKKVNTVEMKLEDTKVEGFKWSEYLKATDGLPAPAHCFKQHSIPPSNNFFINMKLEAIDPRSATSSCIATVVGSLGPRVRLRLDGTDNSNDFWRLVDSNQIQPIGTSDKTGRLLQPPIAFRLDHSFWHMFLIKTLDGAQMAPEDCFVSEPATPRGNLFKAGMKLEAVDRKNPHLICVATIGAVDGDKIRITFDGWKGIFDYWSWYNSRDIFPVGWCDRANYPLQPPGNMCPLLKAPSSGTLCGNKRINVAVIEDVTAASPRKQPKESVTETPTTSTSSVVGTSKQVCNQFPQQQGGAIDPREWDVEHVIASIVSVDDEMGVYANTFRQHEIDGKAMLLLDINVMLRYMGLKLNAALKIFDIIGKFKSKQILIRSN